MGIETTTAYTKKAVKDYISFSMQKGKYYKLLRTVFRVFGPLLLVITLSLMYAVARLGFGGGSDLQAFQLMLTFSLIWMFLVFVYPSIALLSAKQLRSTVNRYVFGAEAFTLYTKANGVETTSEIRYFSLWRVYETESYIYLFADNANAHIVDKSALSAREAMGLRALLQGQVKKYIVCQDA